MQQRAVYLNHYHVGSLRLKKNGDLEFTYENSWLANPHAVPLSITLPLKHKTHSDKYTAPFFQSLSAIDSKELFNQPLPELPGALCFSASGDLIHAPISVEDVDQLLASSPQGQPQHLAVSIIDNEFCLGKNGEFNTHVLKRYEGPENNDLISNEIFCTLIANYLGLPTANISRINLQAGNCLMRERSDRMITVTASPQIYGVPSETMTQALPELLAKKTPPVLTQLELIFNLVRTHGSIPILDVKDLTSFLVICLLCGIDSMPLHQQRVQHCKSGINLLPFSDLICTAILPAKTTPMPGALTLTPDFRKVNKEFFQTLAKALNVSPKYLINLTLRYCGSLPRVTKTIFKDYPSLNTPNTQMISHLITSRTNTIKSLLRAKGNSAAA